MFFTCNECKYTFVAEKTPERCPDCGKIAVRKATEEEIEEYKEYRKLFAEDEKQMDVIKHNIRNNK